MKLYGQLQPGGTRKINTLAHSSWQITDAGLVYLQWLTNLGTLSLYKKKVTDAGIAGLKKALPNCYIPK